MAIVGILQTGQQCVVKARAYVFTSKDGMIAHHGESRIFIGRFMGVTSGPLKGIVELDDVSMDREAIDVRDNNDWAEGTPCVVLLKHDGVVELIAAVMIEELRFDGGDNEQ